MSSIFYDHIVVFSNTEKHLEKISVSKEEKEEVWNLIDEMIHHRVLSTILDKLPNEDHNEFLIKFHATPYDISLIDYVNIRIEGDITKELEKELLKLEEEILKQLNG